MAAATHCHCRAWHWGRAHRHTPLHMLRTANFQLFSACPFPTLCDHSPGLLNSLVFDRNCSDRKYIFLLQICVGGGEKGALQKAALLISKPPYMSGAYSQQSVPRIATLVDSLMNCLSRSDSLFLWKGQGTKHE